MYLRSNSVDETEVFVFEKYLAMTHKVYGWILVTISAFLLGTHLLGFNFVSLFFAYGMGNFTNFLTHYLYISVMLTVFFAIYNLLIANLIKKENFYWLMFSPTVLLIIAIIRNSYFDLFFGYIILVFWIFCIKNTFFHFLSNKLLATILFLITLLIGSYYFIEINKEKDYKSFFEDVYYRATYSELKKLLEQGKNPNVEGRSGNTALYHVNDPRKTQLLIDFGADPNHKNKFGRTPLYSISVDDKNTKAVFDILIKNGADINHQDHKGDTPLHIAVLWGRTKDTEVLLLHEPNLNIRNKKGKTAIDIARERYSFEKRRQNIFNLKRAKKVLSILGIDYP